MHGPVSGFLLQSFTYSVRKLNLAILNENVHETLNVRVPKMFRCIFWKKNQVVQNEPDVNSNSSASELLLLCAVNINRDY